MPTQTRGAKRKAGTLDDEVQSLPLNHRASRPRTKPARIIKDNRSTIVAPPQSAFLNLPPELRNEIYRMCLVEDHEIRIGSQFPLPTQPGILQVSRQVRSETLNIYYKENVFTHYFQDFDCILYRKWYQSSRCRAKCNNGFQVERSTNWANLLEWLRAAYHNECRGLRAEGQGEAADIIFSILKGMKRQKLSWPQAAANLEHVRNLLVLQDPAWA